MAEEIVGVKVKVDTSEATQGVDELNKKLQETGDNAKESGEKATESIGELKKKIKDANAELKKAKEEFGEYSKEAADAAKKVEELNKKLEQAKAPDAIGQLKKDLRAANSELIKAQQEFGDYSQQAIIAAQKVAQLKDRIQEASETAGLFDPGKKFQAFSGALTAVAGGFTAVQGALGLVGIESEDVQKQILKVQSALALSQGLSTIKDSIKDFQRLGVVIQETALFQKANNAVTAIAATVTRAFGGAVDQTATSFKVLKGAIAATGIGLLVVAVGELVSAFQNYQSAAEKAAEAQKELNKTIADSAKVGLDAEKQFIDNEEKLAIARAKNRGASEQEIFDIEQSFRKSRGESLVRYWNEVKNIDIEGASAAEKEIARINSEGAAAKLNFETEQRKKAEERQKQNNEKNKALRQKQQQEEEQALRDKTAREDAAFQVQQDAYVATLDERNQALFAIEQKYEEQRSTLIKAGITDFVAIEEQKRIAIEKVNKDYDEKDKEELKKKQDEALEREQRYIDQQLELLNIRAKTVEEKRIAEIAGVEEDFRRRIELAQVNGEETILLEQLKAEKIKEINEKSAKDEETILKARQDAQLQFASAVGQIFGNLSGLFEQGTAAAKVSALAEIAINTGIGFVQGLDIAQKSAKATGPAAAFAFPIFYATQVAAVLAAASRAKNILSTVKGGGSGGSVTAPLIKSAAPIAPQQPQATVTELNQKSINEIGSATSRAYVLESDVSNSQERIRRINRAARLG